MFCVPQSPHWICVSRTHSPCAGYVTTAGKEALVEEGAKIVGCVQRDSEGAAVATVRDPRLSLSRAPYLPTHGNPVPQAGRDETGFHRYGPIWLGS